MKARRSAPRLWDTDWLVLRPLARSLDELARKVGDLESFIMTDSPGG